MSEGKPVRVCCSSLIEDAPLYVEEFFDGRGPMVVIGLHHLDQLNKNGRTLTDLEDAQEMGVVK